MSTILQQKLAEAIVENLKATEPLNMGELLVKVGYSESIATTKPGQVMEAKGVKDALFRMGFNTDNANRVVAEILNDETNEPKDRLKAAELVYKVQGDFAPEKHMVVTKKIISIDE
jgi:Holliday junction resolvasome RuvABC DNA-binding subunit